jgi:hypothetical protein
VMGKNLEKRGVEEEDIPDMIQHLHQHQKNNKKLSNYAKNIQVDLICNSLVTERRRLPTLARWRGVDRWLRLGCTAKCYICKEAMDSSEHLFGEECHIVSEARNKFHELISTDMSALGHFTLEHALLLFEPISRGVTNAVSVFNATIWIERTNFFKILTIEMEDSEKINRLVNVALQIWNRMRNKGKKKNNRLMELFLHQFSRIYPLLECNLLPSALFFL